MKKRELLKLISEKDQSSKSLNFTRLLLTFCVLALGYTMYLVYYSTEVIKDKNIAILEVQLEKENLRKVVIQNTENYRETLVDIIQTVYAYDSYLNIGGSGKELSIYGDITAYEDLLLGSKEHRALMENVNLFFDERKKYLADIPDIFPVLKNDYNRFSSYKGDRVSPTSGLYAPHNGIDIVSYFGSPIIATADGVVRPGGHWIYHPDLGKGAIIDHANGIATSSWHWSKSFVWGGKVVKKGDVIGLMGATGNVTGVHVHYEVTRNGVPLDPLFFMKRYFDDNDGEISLISLKS